MASQFPYILCTNQNLAAGLAQCVERSTAECKLGRVFDSQGRTSTQGLKITEKMKVLPLPSKQVDLRLARMNT